MIDFYGSWTIKTPGREKSVSLEAFYCRDIFAWRIDSALKHPLHALVKPCDGIHPEHSYYWDIFTHMVLKRTPIEITLKFSFAADAWRSILQSKDFIDRYLGVLDKAYGTETTYIAEDRIFSDGIRNPLRLSGGIRIKGDARTIPCFYWACYMVRSAAHRLYSPDSEISFEDPTYQRAWETLQAGKECPATLMIAHDAGPIKALSYYELYSRDANLMEEFMTARRRHPNLYRLVRSGGVKI